MKTVVKEIDFTLREIKTGCKYDLMEYITLKITTDEPVFSQHGLKMFLEVEEPETIKEFITHHNITKNELVEWLNKNYKNE